MKDNQINLCVIAGQDGGLIMYELMEGSDQVLIFGGDLDASTKYLSSRMSKILNPSSRLMHKETPLTSLAPEIETAVMVIDDAPRE